MHSACVKGKSFEAEVCVVRGGEGCFRRGLVVEVGFGWLLGGL